MDKLFAINQPELQELIRETVLATIAEIGIKKEENITQPAIAEDERFDIPGLAKYLNCSIMTVHKLKKKGELPYYRFGRKYFFKRSEIDKVSKKR